MFKFVLIICLWATTFLLSGARVWSEDMEDRFIQPEFASSNDIFIDVKGASLMDVLKIISKQTGLSFIASEDVADKKVTIYLNKVPLDQALNTILDANNLSYEMQKDTNVFVVIKGTAKHLITKVYQLKYATVFSSPLNSTLNISGGSGSSGAAASAAPAAAAAPAASAAGGGASAAGGGAGATTAAAPTAGGLEAVLQDSLSPDGKVVEDARTNSLIITDKPGQFEIIDSTIAKLDVPIPQVLIEVELLDVSKSTADQLGITYGGATFQPLTFTGGTSSVGWPFFRNPPSSNSSSSSGGSSSSSTSTTTGTPGSVNANGLTATLNYLTTITDSRVLARPRILTLNNQTAQIQISTDQAIDAEQNTSTGGGTTVPTTGYTIDRYTTGVILKVTPQANLSTREVTMAVSPKVVDVILSQIQIPNTKTFDPETRGSDSMLKLHDGQSMVIGGLLRNETDKTISKLPVLGDLPLIGAAFRSKSTSVTERELLIFITPHIIDDPNESVLKEDGSSISAQATSDLQDASDHTTQDIENSLNTDDMKKY